LFINIELTNYQTYGDGLTDKVVELIDKFNLDDWVMFSSFHPSNILRVRKLSQAVAEAYFAQREKLGFPGCKVASQQEAA